jgi:hypothetical protein
LSAAKNSHNEAIRLNPDYTLPYENRAIAFQKKSKYAAAITDYQKYVDLGGGVKNKDQSTIENIIRNLKNKL